MDQEEGKVPGRFDPETSVKNPRSLGNGVVSEAVNLLNSEERDTVCGSNENKGLEVLGGDLGLSEVQIKGHEQVLNPEVIDRGGGSEVLSRVDQVTSETLSNSVGGAVSETVVVINSDEALRVSRDEKGSGAKSSELGSSEASTKEVKKRVFELEKSSCVIDVKCGSGKGFVENRDGERVCRICHLSSEQSSDATTSVTDNATIGTMEDLIQLGCGCKDELGIAHNQCAEAWFKLRGNRLCEICGEIAKNITGIGDNGFMEEWNESRFTSVSSNSSDRGGGCWRGQPFCNFLMACLP
ncbi:hypothetical protein CMV_021594 [Castanea mollissima]|uniref:RING-CH-type domain-containing protein n=1 Tax=Castanea mollissima TaxID=60419 RepID=A0A8J4QWZ0_9ROSI|nr:hypothetical protein CMV_021594 [Castanea mollissima]